MKKMTLLLLALISNVFFNPANAAEYPPAPQLQWLFQQDFMQAEDNVELLDREINKLLMSTGSRLTPNELKEKFKLLASTREQEDQFLDIYASLFDDQELQEVCQWVQDSRYLKYRKKLAEANTLCFEQSVKILENIVAEAEPLPPITILPIVHLNTGNVKKLLSTSRFMIVDVYTDWCGPCKYLDHVIKELHQQYGHLYQFAKLNAEKEKQIAKTWSINAYPTILFIKDGKEVGRHKGYLNKDAFLAQIEEYFQ